MQSATVKKKHANISSRYSPVHTSLVEKLIITAGHVLDFVRCMLTWEQDP